MGGIVDKTLNFAHKKRGSIPHTFDYSVSQSKQKPLLQIYTTLKLTRKLSTGEAYAMSKSLQPLVI
ncbi:hypothetical protein LCGC14_1474540 [marine sediment metagenome]|uniref:Uncharacterized protein n=1 Tax=marine sediment metagenome TaxID=412755 RepID=A0A0F9LRU6_9ZZZZ